MAESLVLVNEERTVLVTLNPDGPVEVATRPDPGATWGPPTYVGPERLWPKLVVLPRPGEDDGTAEATVTAWLANARGRTAEETMLGLYLADYVAEHPDHWLAQELRPALDLMTEIAAGATVDAVEAAVERLRAERGI